MDKHLERLTEMASEVDILESKLKRAREKRNNLALRIIDSGQHSLRKVAEHAGIQNTYLVKLRKNK